MRRLTSAFGALSTEQRWVGAAALAVMVSTLLPWYVVRPLRAPAYSVNAFGVYSFVEAAIFLVALAVLGLLFARGDGREFHLPGGDGTVIAVAGAWTVFLVFYRQFDKPDVPNALVGVDWGMFVTILAGAALGLAGLRLRAARTGGPDLGSEASTDVVPRPEEPEQLSFEDDQDRLR